MKEKKADWHNVLRESDGLVPRYYCNPKVKVQEPEIPSAAMEDCINTVSRYMASVGKLKGAADEKTVSKFLSAVLRVGYSKRYRPLLIQAASAYIEKNQHREFDIRDYKSQILRHTQRLIEESFDKPL